ncbi:hypothetical protein Xcel_3457 (plasmid) [Xylanimonas cellulosilytica DSM 15894]|uniref:DUF3846 domain-containing protein n=1 Tax=Xylanimonas cellulosilytica (strain DSM 15894 / JCM 12276 / CECT 5975 / KCTC 9989 / LMG 20990 / NBRC 107835 / XIL07) TaxID=446471 RepID=D1C0Z0_XYLCX|nr:DUF3846 domain-containing protein [Xylanimonas cellulosilytica]ACZ32456.1 hypothetical protein Xcel_3457 [Xylanimonas cellulosilytica DSM 15894]
MSNTFRVVTIDVEGNVQVTEWDAQGSEQVSKHLQEAVGGWFDCVGLSESLDMWVNDDGIALGLPVNVVATGIAARFGLTHQPYWGPVVFTGGPDADGASRPLGDLMTKAVIFHAEAVKASLFGVQVVPATI